MLKRFFKRLAYKYKRLRVRWRRFSKPALYVDNADAKKSIAIIENLIANNESELIFSPLSRKKCIKNNDIYVIIEDTSFRLVNGKYSYEYIVTDKVIHMLSDKFNARLERDVMKIEKKISSNVNGKLDEILDNVKTHFQSPKSNSNIA